jgi:serpin B
MFKFASILLFFALPMTSLLGQPTSSDTPASSKATRAINAIGIDLLHATSRSDQNALLSPYSIETALAMTYAGADGSTREEMARVLHLNADTTQVAGAFSELQAQLDSLVRDSVRESDRMKQYGQTNDPMVLDVANRLFGEQHYTFRPEFLDLLKTKFNAPLESVDFRNNSAAATKTINDWVAQKTKDRIQDLVPNGALNRRTGLVLVNALYLKAPWAEAFSERATQPLPFYVRGAEARNVPTMSIQKPFGYTRTNGATVVSVPYKGNQLQMLIILPDETNGLAGVEAGLTAEQLASWAALPNQSVKLFLPKFKMQPPTLPLGNALQKLGMKSAFDIPPGSANFDRMAPRRPDDYLAISDVFHKTFISVDEKGTEAAAATAVAMMRSSAMMRPLDPVEVKVDHPFLFAIQHRASGACLFLGHLVDPTAQQSR